MATLTILRYPDPRLQTVARPVATVDARIRQLVDDMRETMLAADGIGLAATQVDVHERVIVIDVSDARDQPCVLINPPFRRLIFRGFRRKDGYGNYAAVRLGQTFADIPMHGVVTFEDCEISGCDDGLLGGDKGQKVVLRRCYFHDNGNETGLTHNVYIGNVDELLVEDVLSTRATIGHLLKSRAARTTIRNTRLIGGGGTESACLDVPNAGVLDIEGLVAEKSPGTDAVWLIHYSGENQDQHGVTFHDPSSVRIQGLTMIAPDKLTRKSASQAIYGFANQSGDGAFASGRGSRLITPQAADVRVYNLSQERAGLPCTALSARPALDMSSPVKLT